MYRQRRAWWTALWVVLAAVVVVRTGVRERGVILDHLEFGRRLLVGEYPYGPWAADDDEPEKPLHAPYPPSFGLLTAPFSVLPSRAGRIAWAVLQIGALLAIAWCLRGWLGPRGPPTTSRFQPILLLTLVLGSRYVLRDTHGGGGNLINLAMGLGTFALAERGRARTAGLLLGFSLATKPSLGLLLPLLWVQGHRRAALWSLGSLAGFALVTLALLRFDPYPFQRWAYGAWIYGRATDVFGMPQLGFPPFSWMNQCLRCALARYLGEVPPELAEQVPAFFPGLGLRAGAVATVARVSGLTLLLATAWAAWRTRAHPDARRWVLAGVFVLSLLLSPISWKAHHVALLPAFFLLLREGFRGARWPFVLAAVYVPTCLLGEELVGKGLKELQQSLYLVTAWDLVLLAVCLVMAVRVAGRVREQGGSA